MHPLGAEFKYRVIWYPHDFPERTKQYDDVDKATAFFEDMKSYGFAPILEERVLNPWETIRNSVLE